MVPSAIEAAITCITCCSCRRSSRLVIHNPPGILSLFLDVLSDGGANRKIIPQKSSDLSELSSGLSLQSLFALPFYYFAAVSPWYIYLIAGPFLLKSCFAWRALEEHTSCCCKCVEGWSGKREDTGKNAGITRNGKSWTRTNSFSGL